MKVHEISKNYVIEGGEKGKICGDDPVKTWKCEIVMYALFKTEENDTLTGRTSLQSMHL